MVGVVKGILSMVILVFSLSSSEFLFDSGAVLWGGCECE